MSAVNRYPTICNFVCRGEKWQNNDHLQLFCNKLCFVVNVLNNKTISLLNLVGCPDCGQLNLWSHWPSIRRYSGQFCRIIVKCNTLDTTPGSTIYAHHTVMYSPVVSVCACSVPVPWHGFGVKRNLETKIFGNAIQEKSGHPELITHVDTFTRTHLVFPLDKDVNKR